MSEATPPQTPAASRLDRLPIAIRWVIYLIAPVAAVTGIFGTVVPLLGGSLSGGWLVLLFGLSLVIFGLVVWLMAAHFNRLFERFFKESQSLRTQVSKALDEAESVNLTLGVARRLNDEIAALGHDESPPNELLFIQRACDGLRDAYKMVGLDTRVCVKQVDSEDHDPPYVTDVYRTNEVVDRNTARHHPIDENTDFRQLYRREKQVWFTGNRSGYPDYVSTSMNPRYESVIVWPIVLRSSRRSGDVPHPPGTIRAFLCLDAEETDAFDRKRDVTVGWMIADALSRAYETTHN